MASSLRQVLRVDLLEGARIALFSLWRNRMRTVLTTVGIGIGVATLHGHRSGITQGMDGSVRAAKLSRAWGPSSHVP